MFWHSNLDHVLLTTIAKQPYYFNPMVCMCFCPINDSIWGSTSYLSYKTTSQESHHFRKTNSPSLEAIDLLMSFFQSPTLHLPLWVVSSASEVRFLYIPLLSESKRDFAKWFQWHSAAFRANDLNCMYSQEMTPWYWYCILICIAFFSQSFYNCTEWVFQSDSTRIFYHYMYCFSLTTASSSINMHELFHDSY